MKFFAALFLSSAIVLASEAAEQTTSITVDELILQKTTPQKRLLTGKVMRAKTIEMAFPKDGRLVYLCPLGTLVRSQLTDESGRVIKPGDLLAQQDAAPYECKVKDYEIKIKIAEAKCKELKTEYERNLKLAGKNVISSKVMLHSETEYKAAESSYHMAMENLNNAKYDLETCYIYAPFRGMVEEVFHDRGTSVGKGNPVLKLSLLSPARVRIKLSPDIIRKLSLTNTYNVYPAGSETPEKAWLDRNYMGTDYIDVFVANLPVGVQHLSENQEKMPKVHKLLFTSNISDYEAEIPMWVPPATLCKDEQGYYVMRARNQFLGKPVDAEFAVERINVKPMDKFMSQGIYKQRALADCGSLKRHQLLVAQASCPLKDGDTVVLQEFRWQFTPGEDVWVNIPGIAEPGYYVPANAIFGKSKGEYHICIDSNGKARKVEIKILNDYEDTFKIEGKALSPGVKVIIPLGGQIISDGEAVKTRKIIENIGG